jgi:hypothetical protein
MPLEAFDRLRKREGCDPQWAAELTLASARYLRAEAQALRERALECREELAFWRAEISLQQRRFRLLLPPPKQTSYRGERSAVGER